MGREERSAGAFRGALRPARSAGDGPDGVRRRGGIARRSAQHASDQAACRQVWRAGDRRCRAVRAGPRAPAAAQGCRHHRHQRQEHHHRAGASYPEERRRADHDGRQYRPPDSRTGAFARRWGLCAGAVELSDRSDVLARLRGCGIAQHYPRSSGPLRELRGLCGEQVALACDADARSEFHRPVHGCAPVGSIRGRHGCEHSRGCSRKQGVQAERSERLALASGAAQPRECCSCH